MPEFCSGCDHGVVAGAVCAICGGTGYEPQYKLCRYCGQLMKPKGVKKQPGMYDHAQGCPYARKKVQTSQ